MTILGRTVRREVVITLIIWLVLLVLACIGLATLRASTSRILHYIYYVNVSRGAKANVLYEEANKYAIRLLKDFEGLNEDSAAKVGIPSDSKDYLRSVQLFDEAMKYDPYPEFSTERIPHYEMLGQLYEASSEPQVDALLMYARASMARGNYEGAERQIHIALDRQSTATRSHVLLAQLRQLQDRTTEGLALLHDLSNMEPLDSKGYWVRANLYQATGEGQNALRDFEQAVVEAPDNIDYRKNFALALTAHKEDEKANRIMAEGLDLGGWQDPAYLHVYGEMLIRGSQYEEAVRILKQADKLGPNSGDIQWSLASAYHYSGQARQAASTLNRAIAIRPELQGRVFKDR